MKMNDDENPHRPRKLAKPDPHHEMHLLRDLAIANARTIDEFGPLPTGGLLVPPKRKPNLHCPAPTLVANEQQEDSEMRFKHIAGTAALAAAGAVACSPTMPADTAKKKVTPPTSVAEAQDAPTKPTSSVVPASPQTEDASKQGRAGAADAIPEEIRTFVGPGVTLLAYKRFDLIGTGNEDAIIITRGMDEKQSTCEISVLHKKGTSFSIEGKNDKIVDCEYNERNIRADYLDLNGYLELSRGEVKFTNENIRGGYSSYSFKYSIESEKWHVLQVVSTYKGDDFDEDGVKVYKETAQYPIDFGFISMSDFDPGMIREVMTKNKRLIP